MGNLLSRKSLLAKESLAIQIVNFPDGNFVYVKEMSGHDRDLFEQSILEEEKDEKGNLTGYKRSLTDFRAKLAVMTVCDEKGNLILQPEDYTNLSSSISASKLKLIVEKAQELNKMDETQKEDLVKNLEAGQPGTSASSSVEN